MSPFELTVAVSGAAYVVVFGTRHALALRSWNKRTGYLPISSNDSPLAPADGLEKEGDEDEASLRRDRAERDAAAAVEASKLLRWAKNVLAFQLPFLAAAVFVAAAALYLSVEAGSDAPDVAVGASSALAWVGVLFACVIACVHIRALSTVSIEAARAPSSLQLSFFYLCSLFIAGWKLTENADTQSAHERTLLVVQAAISATLFFLDGALVYLGSSAVEFSATLERNASGRVVCPEMKASLFSRLTYSYIRPLLEDGVRAPLEESDLWDLNPVDDAKNIEAAFQKFRSTGKPIGTALLRFLAPILSAEILVALIALPAEFLAPYMLNLVVGYVTDPSTTSRSTAFGYVLIMFAGSIARLVCDNAASFISHRASIRGRVAI
ncbi:hypothetical protein BDK51DRAFT_49346, partial [Blyttiomyces helicus]